jgi:hypothetical protein
MSDQSYTSEQIMKMPMDKIVYLLKEYDELLLSLCDDENTEEIKEIKRIAKEVCNYTLRVTQWKKCEHGNEYRYPCEECDNE